MSPLFSIYLPIHPSSHTFVHPNGRLLYPTSNNTCDHPSNQRPSHHSVSHVPGKLKQFVLDLHSGKLHREFHHGPDPTDSTPGQEETGKEVASNPPESSFQKLAPSETRYTILGRDRDEL
ncbi:hypothetical protein ILYODFUR_013503 [Ilyodon furcidens]|uniref:Uncharacterized protein n=1 Tax=Ilyodon furcidens TaxID=33524 RepID=A0ABV0UFS2_9TELE